MPNVMGPLLILAAMEVPVVVTVEAGLSFLGLGVLPPQSSWGTILNEGYLVIRDAPWMVVAGGIPLILTTLGFTFLGEALRDIFDPRMGRGALSMETLLDIAGLSVDFRTSRGRVKAAAKRQLPPCARGASLASSGKRLGQEPRCCGRSSAWLAGNAEVTARNVASQGPRPAAAREAGLRAVRGEEVRVVFQDPMTSQIRCCPYGRQMADILYPARAMSAQTSARPPSRCCARSASQTRLRASTPTARVPGGMRQRRASPWSKGPNLLLADEADEPPRRDDGGAESSR